MNVFVVIYSYTARTAHIHSDWQTLVLDFMAIWKTVKMHFVIHVGYHGG